MSSCPILTGPNVAGLVDDGLTGIKELVFEYKDLALGLINDLVAIKPQPIGFGVTYDVPTNLLQAFVPPDAPVAPDVTLDTSLITDPGTPPDINVGDPSFDALPDFTATPRGPVSKYDPGQLNATAPDLSFTPTAIDEPVLADIDTPDEPSLHDIVLPSLPTITLPTFQGTAPVVDFFAPDGNINFTVQPYASTLLDDIKARLVTMVSGQVGLPLAIENALFARARDREDVIKQQAIREAKEDAGNMGHSLPPGSLMAHVADIRKKAMDDLSATNREIVIEMAKSDREFLHRAIERGIALEGALMNNDLQQQELGLRVAEAQLRASVEVFNANVSLFNAKGQLYAIEAQVYRDLIAAENLKLDQYKAQIDAQRLIGEVNRDLLALYESRLRARNLLIEQYRARLEAVKTVVERDNLRLEQKRLLLQEYDATITAWSKQWDVVAKQYEADASNGKLFEAQASAYAALVNAKSAGNRNKIDQKRLSLDVQLGKLTGWRGTLEKSQFELQTAVELLKGELGTFDGKARIYSAGAEVAKAKSDANTRSVQVLLESLRAKADLAMENVRLQVTQFIQLLQAQIEGLKSGAQFVTQLGAGATAALNFSASASESNSVSNSVSCGTSLSGSAD